MGSEEASGPGAERNWKMPVPGLVVGMVVLLLLLTPVLWWQGQLGNFFTLANLQGLLHDNAVPAVVALGMLIVIISGGIDLSVGSVVALVTVTTMQVYRLLEGSHSPSGWSSVAAVSAGIGV